ncbi:MAG: arylsulfatase [Kiritimatiellales bacterium]|nr:arylsulfatase [Kiritimatiellales bacterium]
MTKSLLAGIVLTAGAFVALADVPAKPNIVLVLADDLGWGDIGYHDGQAKTPNLDRISAEGIRFDRFYAQPICTPTRAALMTGRYSWRTGMASGVILNHLHYGLPLDETTLGQIMKSAGYATYIVGKWHLGHETPEYLPTERGFDYHYGLYTAMDHFTHEWQGALDWHRNRKPVREEGYATDLLGEDCVRIIKGHDFKKQPLFLYHPMFAVHAWNQSTPEYMAPYADVADKDRRGLLGLCAAMDYQFGQIIQALEKAGQLDNTLVLFMSDNGGNAHASADNGPLRGSKGTYYEGGLRVPAFAYWPGKIKGGRTTEALMHVTDIFPTFGKLAGAKMPAKALDGFDLSPVLFGNAETTGRMEIPFILEDSERERRGAIIDWPWKLRRTATENGPWVYELFNIADDPFEKVEGHQTGKAYPEITDRLSKRLDALKKDAPPALWKKGDGNTPKGWKPPPIIGPDQE